MRILISGGGIAGLTLAYWLHHYGFQPCVIEQADGIRRDGYGIDFFGTGYDVAERMGIIEQLKDQPLPMTHIAYVNGQGQPTSHMDMDFMRKIMNGKYIGLMHWTLEEALYEKIANQVEFRSRSSLQAIQQEQDGVTVTFQDGTTEKFDLLIGADGVHSQTRTLVFGPEEQFSRPMGYTIACYPLRDRYNLHSTWTMYPEAGRLVGAYGSNHDEEIITLFMHKTEDKTHIPREQRLSHLCQTFAGMGWLTTQLLNDTPDSTSIFMDTATQIQMPTWHNKRVALVGDACGCPTLISGQGASLAMGGAYILAEALHEQKNYQDAFRSYENQMLSYVTQQQNGARGQAKYFAPGSKLEVQLQYVVLKLLMRPAFTGLLRQVFGAESLLQTRVK